MISTLENLPAAVREGPLALNLEDAEYFLSVGQALCHITNPLGWEPGLRGPLLGETEPWGWPMWEPESVVTCDHPRFAPTLEAIGRSEVSPDFEMFGGDRLIDFTQFQPRSYYTRSLQLTHYFQAMMWLARADLRVFGGTPPVPPEQTLRELGTAVTLALLLKQSDDDLVERWQQMDRILRLFVGRTDSMNFGHLLPLLDAYGISSFDSVTSPEQLAELQAAIAQGVLGLQLIPGDVHLTPFGPEQAQLPRAFAFNGQRFVPDSWALGQVTYDRIVWPEEIPSLTDDRKVLRRMCSSLDVAYSVLGNPSVADLIAERMLTPWEAGNFRDGYPYAHNLVAAKQTVDQFSTAAWTDSLYTRWLYALRALSEPTLGAEYPQAMRTRAWSRRTLNTQLASYAELKHDTLLYGKQPYASSFLCEYPAGFVEPVPEFWARMAALADAAAAGQEAFSIEFTSGLFEYRDPVEPTPYLLSSEGRHQARITACRTFSAHMKSLEALARKELQQEPFTDDDVLFIRGLMNSQDHAYVGPTYDGWYPELYYEDYALLTGSADENGCNKRDPLVVDIFTAPPDLHDPVGGVLHQATGDINLLLISVDNGPDRMVYAGPVMSYYDFVLPGLERMTDEEWKSTNFPAPPEWTEPYLVGRSSSP
jgi:hypothetical protein